jgi:hypothetical protein
VWYFSENTHELEDGLITTIEGTFMAGVNGDKPGIIMKAHPAIGDFTVKILLEQCRGFRGDGQSHSNSPRTSWDVPELPKIERDYAFGTRSPRIQILCSGGWKCPDDRCENRRQEELVRITQQGRQETDTAGKNGTLSDRSPCACRSGKKRIIIMTREELEAYRKDPQNRKWVSIIARPIHG